MTLPHLTKMPLAEYNIMDHPADYSTQQKVHAKNVPYSEKTSPKLNPLKRLAA
jgi:hypothetical protein